LYDLILRDATIVTSSGRLVADVAIKGRRIAYVGPRPPRRAREDLSAIGKFLIPGVVDTAFHLGDDLSQWAVESRAAVSGGVTTAVLLPGGRTPVVDSATARERIQQVEPSSWCDFAQWGGAASQDMGALTAAWEEGLIVGVLAYLDGHGPDGLGLGPDQLPLVARCPGVLGVQIDPADLASGDTLKHSLAAAREHHHAVHLMHLSTAAELQMLDPVRGALPLTAGVTPHHLFLSTDGDNNGGSEVLTQPPVRPEQDRRTLWTAIKRGRLDCVASYHHARAAGNPRPGAPGAELLLPLMLSAVKYGRLSLELLVSLCCESPARIFGIQPKGRIEKGADADLILFTEGEVEKVTPAHLLSGAGWSPYLEREAAPKPELVMVGGQVVARRGEVVSSHPAGCHI